MLNNIISKIKSKVKSKLPDRYNIHSIPFPALSAEDRYFFDLYGYVIVENVLNDIEINEIKKAINNLWDDVMKNNMYPIHENDQIKKTHKAHRGVIRHTVVQDKFMAMNRVEYYDISFQKYFCNPFVLGVVEELCGSNVRISCTNAIMNKGSDNVSPEIDFNELHKSQNGEFRNYYKNDLYHPSLVRALVTLNDLDEESGGTCFVPGSHKQRFLADEVRDLIKKKPNIIKQMVAPRGSILFFSEDLIHGKGVNKSNNDRQILVAQYAPTRFQPWITDYFPSKNELDTWPKEFRPLLTGDEGYGNYGVQDIVKNRKITD